MLYFDRIHFSEGIDVNKTRASKKCDICHCWHFLNFNLSSSFKFHFFHPRDVDLEKVLVSNKISFGEKSYKYFIGYLCNYHKVKPLHIMLPKASAYVKSYDNQTKWMYFLIENDDLLEKHNTI